MHFTPTSASWLKSWWSAGSVCSPKSQFRRGVHQSSAELETAIYRYLDVTNEDPKPFVWTKTADQILANVAHFCQRTLNTGHYVLYPIVRRIRMKLSKGTGNQFPA